MSAKSLQPCLTLQPHGLYVVRQAPLFMGLSRSEYWWGCDALLQGFFPIRGSTPSFWCLLRWRWFLHHHHHLGRPHECVCSLNVIIYAHSYSSRGNKDGDLPNLTSSRAAAGSPCRLFPSLSTSSNRNTGLFTPTVFKPLSIRPGMLPT